MQVYTELSNLNVYLIQVRRPEMYGWEPRRLLSQLVDIYLHLDSPQFHSALAADEVRLLDFFLIIIWGLWYLVHFRLS